MKKIIIFENLNILNLFLTFFLKLFIKNIYYRKKDNFLKSYFFKKIINLVNIHYIGLDGLDWSYCKNGFEITKKLKNDLTKKHVLKNYLSLSFTKDYKVNLDKFRLCLESEIYNLGFEGASISLIEKNFTLENYKIYYFPAYISSYLLLNNYHKNLRVFSITILLTIISSILLKFIRLFKNYFKKFFIFNNQSREIKKSLDLEKFELAYFPHQSIKYGKGAYSKNLIFEDDPNKKTFKSKIINILKEPFDKFSIRYFKFYDIPFVNFKSLNDKLEIKKIFKLLFSFRVKKFTIFDILLSYFIFTRIIQILKNLNSLKKFKNLKLVYCDYDILFPKTILLACDILKIKTISNQERYLANFMWPSLFYNYYLVTGENYIDRFNNSGYVIDKYYVTGTFRSAHNLNAQKLKYKKEILRLKSIEKKKVLCLGTIISSDLDDNLGEDGTTIKNNVEFLTKILKLADIYNDLYFVIRFKIDQNYNLLPKDLLQRINDTSNIELNKVSSKINIYELLSLSNLVIGRYTSLIEESLSFGIDAIIYDEINFWGSTSVYHPVDDILSAKNENELINYIEIFKKGQKLYSDDFHNNLKFSFYNNSGAENPKFKVQKIINELI